MYIVVLDPVKKALKKVPHFIRDKVQIWADMVEKEGLSTVQKVPGFKDHALRGTRKGQRAIYLNRKWRLVYTISKEGQPVIVTIKEVMPHEY